jgi:hypothetical protein
MTPKKCGHPLDCPGVDTLSRGPSGSFVVLRSTWFDLLMGIEGQDRKAKPCTLQQPLEPRPVQYVPVLTILFHIRVSLIIQIDLILDCESVAE